MKPEGPSARAWEALRGREFELWRTLWLVRYARMERELVELRAANRALTERLGWVMYRYLSLYPRWPCDYATPPNEPPASVGIADLFGGTCNPGGDPCECLMLCERCVENALETYVQLQDTPPVQCHYCNDTVRAPFVSGAMIPHIRHRYLPAGYPVRPGTLDW